MNINDAQLGVRIKVGLFTVLGVLLVGAITVVVNDRPFWWRGCNLVHINIPDATGLKTKSPIRSLGIQIGFLKSIDLYEEYVRLGICITAPVEVLPETKAYIRGEGFLGDKFVELKPVKYLGTEKNVNTEPQPTEKRWIQMGQRLFAQMIPNVQASTEAIAAPTPQKKAASDIPVAKSGKDTQQLIGEVNQLVEELTGLTKGLKEAELKETVIQLNKTLKNAERTLSPDGGLTNTAQRSLEKLEDAISQLNQIVSRVNQGKGSVGMVLNDPAYAEELLKAIKNLNQLLSKVRTIKLLVNVGASYLGGYAGTRSWFQIGLFPDPDRYYLLGFAVDPRGKLSTTTTTTTVGGTSTTTETTQIEQGGILLTGMLGKVLWRRLDLAVGILNGDGAISASVYLGPYGSEDRLQIRNDFYFHSDVNANSKLFHVRSRVVVFPSGSPYLENIYLSGGMETFRSVNGSFAYEVGAGLSFDDEDIKMLFSFL